MDANPIHEETLERFFAAIRAGDFDGCRATLASPMRAELDEHVSGDEDRQAFLAMQQGHAPDRFEMVEPNETGNPDVAGYRVRTTKATPDGEKTAWLVVEFAEEDGACRLHGLFPAAAPESGPPPVTKKAADDRRGEVGDYREEARTNVGGPLLRAEFGDEYGLLVLRVVDSEQSVFTPPREELRASGLDPDRLVPGTIVEADGHPHATDDCKVLATRVTIR